MHPLYAIRLLHYRKLTQTRTDDMRHTKFELWLGLILYNATNNVKCRAAVNEKDKWNRLIGQRNNSAIQKWTAGTSWEDTSSPRGYPRYGKKITVQSWVAASHCLTMLVSIDKYLHDTVFYLLFPEICAWVWLTSIGHVGFTRLRHQSNIRTWETRERCTIKSTPSRHAAVLPNYAYLQSCVLSANSYVFMRIRLSTISLYILDSEKFISCRACRRLSGITEAESPAIANR